MSYNKDNIFYNKELDYCSYSPDKILGVNHNYGCYLHDRQYRNEVKKRKTRKQADIQLRDVMYGVYSKNNKKILGWIVSRIYYIVVRIFGGITWKN